MPKRTLKQARAEADAFNEAFNSEDEISIVNPADPDNPRLSGRVVEGAIVDKAADGYPVVAGVDLDPHGNSKYLDVNIRDIRKQNVECRKTSNLLRVNLTTDDKLFLGEEIADAAARGEQVTAELDTIKKAMTADIRAAEARISANAEKLRAGYVIQAVDCRLFLDFDLGKATEVRKDTGEVLQERDLYPEELQRGLDLGEDGEAKSGLEVLDSAKPAAQD